MGFMRGKVYEEGFWGEIGCDVDVKKERVFVIGVLLNVDKVEGLDEFVGWD